MNTAYDLVLERAGRSLVGRVFRNDNLLTIRYNRFEDGCFVFETGRIGDNLLGYEIKYTLEQLANLVVVD